MRTQKSSNNKINTNIIKKTAKKLGFDFCGIAPATKLTTEKHRYEKWLSMKCHGKMGYLNKNLSLRFNPSLLLDNARSVISLAVNYYPAKKQNPETKYRISKYAYGKDYHLVLKEKLLHLLDHIYEQSGNVNGRAFVDSAPVMEKSWAQKAGLGWIGKNGCLIIPQYGSFVFLCELIIDIELEYDKPFQKNRCGNCTLCIEICPSGAISKEGFVNAQKCISYLNIEMKDHIDENAGHNLFNWVFGCDICQDICPWNRFARPENKNLFGINKKILDLTNKQWENLSKEKYISYIKNTNSVMTRIKYEKLKNNIQICRK